MFRTGVNTLPKQHDELPVKKWMFDVILVMY